MDWDDVKERLTHSYDINVYEVLRALVERVEELEDENDILNDKIAILAQIVKDVTTLTGKE